MPTELGVTNYIVRVTDANGCKERDIVYGHCCTESYCNCDDVTICAGESATLTANAGAGNGAFNLSLEYWRNKPKHLRYTWYIRGLFCYGNEHLQYH